MTADQPQPPPIPDDLPPQLPPLPDADERLWATLAHVSYFIVGIIGPLLIMLCHDSWLKRRSAFVYHHARQALGYQAAVVVLVLISMAVAFATCGAGIPLVFVVSFGGMVFPVLACMAVSRNEWYVYPGMNLFLN